MNQYLNALSQKTNLTFIFKLVLNYNCPWSDIADTIRNFRKISADGVCCICYLGKRKRRRQNWCFENQIFGDLISIDATEFQCLARGFVYFSISHLLFYATTISNNENRLIENVMILMSPNFQTYAFFLWNYSTNVFQHFLKPYIFINSLKEIVQNFLNCSTFCHFKNECNIFIILKLA